VASLARATALQKPRGSVLPPSAVRVPERFRAEIAPSAFRLRAGPSPDRPFRAGRMIPAPVRTAQARQRAEPGPLRAPV